MKSSRRLVAVSLLSSSLALALTWGCSTGDTHPPTAGDCVGSLCPPSRSTGGTGTTTTDGSVVDSGGGTIDSGTVFDATIDDSGSDAAVDDSGNDGALDDGSDADTDGSPLDSGGD